MQSKKPSQMSINAIRLAVLGILPLVAACSSTQFATYQAAGTDFPRAEYQVLGKTRYDQTWIDKTVEAEVAGFGFKRPSKRPAALGTGTHKVVVKPAVAAKPLSLTPATPPVVTVVPKKHWWQRLKKK